jgi:hypothetical protein
MMTFSEVRAAVAQQCSDDDCLRECCEGLASADVHAMLPGPGHMTAGDAFQTFRIRLGTSRSAAIETCGLDKVVAALGALQADEIILLFHFSSQSWLFTIFVQSSRRSIVGYVRNPPETGTAFRVFLTPARVRLPPSEASESNKWSW